MFQYFRLDDEVADDQDESKSEAGLNGISADSQINQVSEYYTDGTISASYV